MDNKVIVDDVDVSKCNFILERDGKIKCECCHATGFGIICNCESWKTCDYKNYKRKEQECEELKRQYKELGQCSKRLKDYYDKEKETLSNRFLELKQTLIETKEIAEINSIDTCWTVLELCEKCNENKECDIQCPFFKFKVILQKISEVLND